MSAENAVQIDEVVKSFGPLRALDGVTLHVRRGEVYGLLGPNGSGKTTLIRLIVGLFTADSGSVHVLGRRMPDIGVLREVGYMTQAPALYPDLSVEENVRFFGAVNDAEAGVDEALRLVELYDRADRDGRRHQGRGAARRPGRGRFLSTEHAIEIDQVAKSFGKLQALSGVSLNVREGEVYGLLGPNGSGKTTLIRLIVGLLAADSGTVRVLGRVMPEVGVLQSIGYMTQAAALYPDLSVEENVRFFAAVNDAEAGVADALRLVEIYDRRASVVGELSGGLRQRCSLACALVHKPHLLLLDEPTVGIDPQLRVVFWDQFREMAAAGTTIVVSSHVMDEAERCQRLGLLRFGRLLAEGSVAELKMQAEVDSLEAAFLKLSEAA